MQKGLVNQGVGGRGGGNVGCFEATGFYNVLEIYIIYSYILKAKLVLSSSKVEYVIKII